MASLNFGMDFGAARKAGQTGDFSSFTQAGTSLPTEPTLPSWLPTDPNAMNAELRSEYGKKRKGLFGAVEAGNAIENLKGYNMSMGMTAANNAASDYTNRILQAGGQALDAGAVKAQALMPVLQQNAGLELEKQDRLTTARMKAAEMKANLAGAINQSRLGYLGQLAGAYTTMRGQNITSDYQNKTLANLGGGAGGASGTMGLQGRPSMQSASPGYIPNTGPVNPAMLNGQTQFNSAFVGLGGMGASALLGKTRK